MEDNRIYPEHIYEPKRIQMATELLQKELRKLLPSASTEAWNVIDKDIAGWQNGGVNRPLESRKIQDFWDIFDAIIGGIKLKPLFIAYITASNYFWEKQTLDPADIYSSTVFDSIEGLPFVTKGNNRFKFGLAKKFFNANPEQKNKERTISNLYCQDRTQDDYPIFAVKDKKGITVLDGNRRTLAAIVYDKPTIKAWVATTDGRKPRDYWMPINHMMSLVFSYKFAVDNGLNPDPEAYKKVLADWFKQSRVAKISFDKRVANQNFDWLKDII
jgi:hypothetical protein